MLNSTILSFCSIMWNIQRDNYRVVCIEIDVFWKNNYEFVKNDYEFVLRILNIFYSQIMQFWQSIDVKFLQNMTRNFYVKKSIFVDIISVSRLNKDSTIAIVKRLHELNIEYLNRLLLSFISSLVRSRTLANVSIACWHYNCFSL